MTPFLSTESSKAGPTGGLLSGRFTLIAGDVACRGNDERTFWCLVYGTRCRFHNGCDAECPPLHAIDFRTLCCDV
jgi:hypothetical protein